MPAETEAQVIAIVKQTKARSGWNAERTLSTLGVAPVIWHRGKPAEVRDERARRIAAARAHRKTIDQQRSNEAA